MMEPRFNGLVVGRINSYAINPISITATQKARIGMKNINNTRASEYISANAKNNP